MTYLVTYEHVVHNARSIIPHGKGQHTAIHVKGCCRGLAMLYDKVLGSKETSEVAFDFLGMHDVLFVMHI
jgi:hypothetical protein